MTEIRGGVKVTAMSTFELQTFHAGKWDVDSYFDDRELAMSEAEKLDVGGRHSGVRVLQEDFSEDSNRSRVRVIFSKMKDASGGGDDDWRVKIQREKQRASGMRGGDEGEMRGRGRRRQPKSRSNMYLVISIGIIILLAGVAAMIGLQEFAKKI